MSRIIAYVFFCSLACGARTPLADELGAPDAAAGDASVGVVDAAVSDGAVDDEATLDAPPASVDGVSVHFTDVSAAATQNGGVVDVPRHKIGEVLFEADFATNAPLTVYEISASIDPPTGWKILYVGPSPFTIGIEPAFWPFAIDVLASDTAEDTTLTVQVQCTTALVTTTVPLHPE